MTYNLSDDARDTLRRAFKDQQLTLYLGAGVSVASALPTWDKLVLSVYFAAISEKKLGKWRPFPNYLYAIAEWYLREVREPLEVTARKLRQLYLEGEEGEEQFLFAVRDGLYRIEAATLHDSGPPEIASNATLQAVAQLCTAKAGQRYGVRSVVTYNYDNLLERALEDEDKRQAVPVYSQSTPPPELLPIFHVHGFIPFPQDGEPRPSGVVFTEEEYNAAASDPYSWSNLVQLREMSSSVGLMVGLSLSDRNIRRLLDALALSPVRAQIYAVLKRPDKHVPDTEQVDRIDKAARKLLNDFAHAGIKSRAMGIKDMGYQRSQQNPQVKSEDRYQREIRGILEAVEDLAEEQETRVMQKLGITPIWFDHFTEIPNILKEITSA